MTTLLDIFRDLTYGELSQFKIGNLDIEEFESEPDPKDYAQLIHHINRGLTALYSRFWLASEEVIIQLQENIEIYYLSTEFAQTNTESTQPVKYIMDTEVTPFTGNVLKIEEIYDEGGTKQCLNDLTEENSFFTPSYRSVQVPWPNDLNAIAVMYRANHKTLPYEYTDRPENIEVAVPEQLREGLTFYVASRHLAGMQNDQSSGSAEYFQRYNNLCLDIEQRGLFIQPEMSDWRFDANGWR